MATEFTNIIPETLPVTVQQYRLLVEQGEFANSTGQIELIYGKIVRMNPQGPVHSDPIDELQRWSYEVAGEAFRVRIEKPFEIVELNSTPEADIAWVTRRRYADRHPTPADIHLLIEVSNNSKVFDRGEKLQLYAAAGIREYWIVDVVAQTVEVFTQPESGKYSNSSIHAAEENISPTCLPTATLEIACLFSEIA